MAARYVIALALGAGITLALLFVMQLLVASDGARLDEARDLRITDFVRVEREMVPERREHKPERPPEPERPPQMPNPEMEDFSSALAISLSMPSSGAQLERGALGIGITDGEALPISLVQPIYPQRAAMRGLEGYVVVQFTITRAGTTRDVVVVESSNSVFDRAAVDAAYRFRFRPQVIGGEAVEIHGAQYRFTFELED